MFASKRFLVVFESIMGGILIFDIDVWVKILTLIIAAIVGWYSVRANKAAERKSNIEADIKTQELYKLIEENNKKFKEKQTKTKDNEKE